MDDSDAMPRESETLIDRMIAGKYRIQRLLGRGGMGAVYAAENTWTKRQVAIKVLRAGLATDRDAVSRFLQEARTTTSLRHPHIVDVLDMGREPDDGTIFIVQEFLEGGTLRARLTEAGPLAVDEARDVLAPILGALEAAHARGIVHRDLKPENIFLTRGPDGALVPKLIDFGISKVVREDADPTGHRTRTGSMVGTPAYMSPEQARSDKAIDARTDLWSAGVVLYELLCGRVPFDGGSFGLTISQLITAEVPRIETFAPEVPRELATVVHRALERDRERRFASAAAFRDALLACPTTAAAGTRGGARISLTLGDTLPGGEQGSDARVSAPPQDTPEKAPVVRDLPPSAPGLASSKLGWGAVGAALLSMAAITAWWFSWDRPPTSTESHKSRSASPRLTGGAIEGNDAPRPRAPGPSPSVATHALESAAPAVHALDGGPAAAREREPRGGVRRVAAAHATVDAGAPDARSASGPAPSVGPGVGAPGDSLRPADDYPSRGAQ